MATRRYLSVGSNGQLDLEVDSHKPNTVFRLHAVVQVSVWDPLPWAGKVGSVSNSRYLIFRLPLRLIIKLDLMLLVRLLLRLLLKLLFRLLLMLHFYLILRFWRVTSQQCTKDNKRDGRYLINIVLHVRLCENSMGVGRCKSVAIRSRKRWEWVKIVMFSFSLHLPHQILLFEVMLLTFNHGIIICDAGNY